MMTEAPAHPLSNSPSEAAMIDRSASSIQEPSIQDESKQNVPLLNRSRMLELLNEVGRQIAKHGTLVEVAIFGGSALVLQFNFREATEDVDYIPVRGRNRLIKHAARVVAEKHNLPVDWFNDAIQLNPLSQEGRTQFFGDFPADRPGLRVFVACPEYILAMKILAMRSSLATKDIEDIWHLWDHLGIQTAEQAIDVCKHYYPKKNLPQRHTLLLGDIEDAKREGTPYSPSLGY